MATEWDKVWFRLDEDAFEEFVDQLERPAVLKPRLQELMNDE